MIAQEIPHDYSALVTLALSAAGIAISALGTFIGALVWRLWKRQERAEKAFTEYVANESKAVTRALEDSSEREKTTASVLQAATDILAIIEPKVESWNAAVKACRELQKKWGDKVFEDIERERQRRAATESGSHG